MFPCFERVGSVQPIDLVMPNQIPNVPYLIELHGPREVASRVLYKEIPYTPVDPWHIPGTVYPEYKPQASPTWTRIEFKFTPYWLFVETYTRAAVHDQALTSAFEDALWKTSIENINELRETLESLRLPSSTTLKPKDEPTMFYENMLMFCYAVLELLRALFKLSELLREKVGGKTKTPLKSWLTKEMLTVLVGETEKSFVAVRDVAQSYIDLIKKRGAVAIKAQVQWGPTGKALMGFLKEEDVEFYAKEYVNSAVEAWSGVLKVKLK